MRVTDDDSKEMGKDDQVVASNEQKKVLGDDEYELETKTLTEAQSRFITGFKTSESNVNDLGNPIHERYF